MKGRGSGESEGKRGEGRRMQKGDLRQPWQYDVSGCVKCSLHREQVL